MSKCKSKQVSDFSLEGRFLDFVFEDGHIKYLRIATKEGEFWIKLCKELRSSFNLRLIQGDWVQVVGERKLDLKNGKLKLKAQRVIPAATHHQQETSLEAVAKPAKAKTNILVCQKSDCMKRGGKGVCQALEAVLSERGLEDQVAIKGTGCMKQCSSGPNIVMPDKTRYSRIQAAQIPELIEKHFPAEAVDEKKPIEPELQREVAAVRAFFTSGLNENI